MEIFVFWDVAQCNLVDIKPTFQKRLLPLSAGWWCVPDCIREYSYLWFCHNTVNYEPWCL